MVPEAGLEPARRYTLRRILSPVRLPIPPLRQDFLKKYEDWRRHPDSNRGVRVLQTRALPLGYAAVIKMERKTGFEPATPTLARWCSTTELLPQLIWLG